MINVSILSPASPPGNFKHQLTLVNEVIIHYVIGGKGPLLVLLHGFGENWYVWNRLLPELSEHFTVIVPDLRGIGESGKPEAGYDKKTMAKDIHELVRTLGYQSINLVGHDIGLMVAYSYASEFGSEVKRVALMDAMIPGIEPVWEQISTTSWHIGFFARPIAGDLVAGREGTFLRDFWSQHIGENKNSFAQEETDEFIRAYSSPGSMTASFKWYKAFSQDVADNHEFMKEPLPMPLLAMGGEYSTAPFLADHAKIIATSVEEVRITGAGHWLVQEQPGQVLEALLNFFIQPSNSSPGSPMPPLSTDSLPSSMLLPAIPYP